MCRIEAQVDLHALSMTVRGHVTCLPCQESQVPRVVIAVDEGNDRNAEVGHDERGLVRCLHVSSDVDTAVGGDLLNDFSEAPSDSFYFRVPGSSMRGG